MGNQGQLIKIDNYSLRIPCSAHDGHPVTMMTEAVQQVLQKFGYVDLDDQAQRLGEALDGAREIKAPDTEAGDCLLYNVAFTGLSRKGV